MGSRWPVLRRLTGAGRAAAAGAAATLADRAFLTIFSARALPTDQMDVNSRTVFLRDGTTGHDDKHRTRAEVGTTSIRLSLVTGHGTASTRITNRGAGKHCASAPHISP